MGVREHSSWMLLPQAREEMAATLLETFGMPLLTPDVLGSTGDARLNMLLFAIEQGDEEGLQGRGVI